MKSIVPSLDHPQLSRHARYRWDSIRQQHQLVFPEGLLILNETGTAILKLCDGQPFDQLLLKLQKQFQNSVCEQEVITFLRTLATKGLVNDIPPS